MRVNCWAAAKPDWLANKWVVHLVQIGPSRLPEIGDVPLFVDLVKNPADRQVAEFLSSAIALGRTIFAPPRLRRDHDGSGLSRGMQGAQSFDR